MGHEAAEQVWALTRWVENKLDAVFEARETYDASAAFSRAAAGTASDVKGHLVAEKRHTHVTVHTAPAG